MHHDRVRFIPGIQTSCCIRRFNTEKAISVMHHITGKEQHVIISLHAEKAFEEFKFLS